MLRKVAVLIFGAGLLASIYGCFAIVAGAAGGAGTAVWLSGKLTQEVNYPFDHAEKAAESGLGTLSLPITKKTVSTDVAQLISTYTDGKTIWVDVKRISEASSKIEVRVGAVNSDKQAADRIMTAIRRSL